jgi:ankyrin repeat protein
VPDQPPTVSDLPINDVVFIGDLAELKRRLAAGADPNDDVNGHTLLMVVAGEPGDYYSDTEVAITEALLTAGADVHRVDRTGRTALHAAAQADNAAVGRLLTAGCDPNQRAFDGSTPLHDAARGPWLATIELLLAAGSRVDLVDGTGSSPLDIAEGLGKLDEPERSEAIQLLRTAASRTPGD